MPPVPAVPGGAVAPVARPLVDADGGRGAVVRPSRGALVNVPAPPPGVSGAPGGAAAAVPGGALLALGAGAAGPRAALPAAGGG